MSDYDYSLEACTRDRRTFEFRGKPFTVACCDVQWHPSNWSFQDEVEVRDRWWTVKEGDVVLDVGGDFGSYALTALAAGARRVVSWSPPFKRPDYALECLTMRASAELNGWGGMLDARPSGLWREPGHLAAFDGPRPAVFCGRAEDALRAIEGQGGHVSTFPVDSIDRQHFGECDWLFQPHLLGVEKEHAASVWLKIDTEGCELAILEGGEQTIDRLRPRIILEHHYHIDPQCEPKCDVFLGRLGYYKVGTVPHGAVAHSLYLHRDDAEPIAAP